MKLPVLLRQSECTARKVTTPVALLVLLIFSAACSSYSEPAPTPELPPNPVPATYQPLYTELESNVRTYEQFVAGLPAGVTPPPAFSAELMVANANRGTELLQPQALGASALVLDRFQSLGITAVLLSVQFPVLEPQYPNSAGYRAFYVSVAQQVRARGMKLIVEFGPIFAGTVFSSLPVSYTGVTLDSIRRAWRGMTSWTLTSLQPDYINLIGEPTSFEAVTGIPFPSAQYGSFLTQVLSGLSRGSTKIGSGLGSWEAVSFAQAALTAPIDYLDVHMYPVQPQFMSQYLPQLKALADAKGIKLACAETWLYKIAQAELTTVNAVEPAIFARDVYSFWAPLDARYLAAQVRLARGYRMEYLSLFWGRHLFAYLQYTDAVNALTPAERFALADQAASPAIVSGTFSTTAQAYRDAIR
jgi:hypothetical protein